VSELALLGGTPAVPKALTPYRSLGDAEVKAVVDVVQSGCLSGFYGTEGDQFLGGPRVRAFEEAWCERFGVRFTISMNSATSGLFAAVGAAGIGPGDEVIVSPYTMSATAMAPLVYGGIPIFVDIESATFCLDPDAVRNAITPRTRAILAVNLFGHPAPLRRLKAIAEEHGLMLIEDNAQGPLAMEDGRYAGTIGHIGVFSLNYHKHIHTGEGGMCVTDDPDLALRLQLIRNHGENVVEPLGVTDLSNLVGFNYRMTELSAAIGLEQLARIDDHVGRREAVAARLSGGVEDLPGLVPPVVRPGCRHVYYVWALRYLEEQVGVPRAVFSRALTAEGFPHFVGYVRPLYLLPLFQQRIAMGRHGFPFTLSDVRYEAGLCPVVERMHASELLAFEPCAYDLEDSVVDALVAAIRKVYAHRAELAELTP
jgi:dTDP-4-amino-4,6-dideoxygalactose transaminase